MSQDRVELKIVDLPLTTPFVGFGGRSETPNYVRITLNKPHNTYQTTFDNNESFRSYGVMEHSVHLSARECWDTVYIGIKRMDGSKCNRSRSVVETVINQG